MFEALQQVDLSILFWLRSYQQPALIVVAGVIAIVADKGWLWWMIVVGNWLKGNRRFAAHAGSALVIASAAGLPLKGLIGRPRPGLYASQQLNLPMSQLLNTEHSFPSGHTLLAAAFAFVIITYVKDWRAWLALLFVGAIGLARVYQGMHWPSDVVGSIVLGALAANAAKYVVNLSSIRKFIEPKTYPVATNAGPVVAVPDGQSRKAILTERQN